MNSQPHEHVSPAHTRYSVFIEVRDRGNITRASVDTDQFDDLLIQATERLEDLLRSLLRRTD